MESLKPLAFAVFFVGMLILGTCQLFDRASYTLHLPDEIRSFERTHSAHELSKEETLAYLETTSATVNRILNAHALEPVAPNTAKFYDTGEAIHLVASSTLKNSKSEIYALMFVWTEENGLLYYQIGNDKFPVGQ